MRHVGTKATRLSVLFLFLILALLLVPVGAALAQEEDGAEEPREAPQVSLTDRRLCFQGEAGEALGRTFTLTVDEGTIEGVTVVRHDLLDARSGAVILSDQITVDPESRDMVAGRERFSVTIKGGERPGRFVGLLEVQYKGQPDDAPLEIILDVTLAASPSVDAETGSKNLTLELVHPFFSLPIGRPRAAPASRTLIFPWFFRLLTGRSGVLLPAPPLGEVAVSLIQSAEGEAVVEGATVLSMRGPGNRTLPDGSLAVDTELPLTIAGRGAANLQVVGRGKHLDAGEYNGTLHVTVRDQEPVQVPIKVLVKDGGLLPLIVLALGPLVGTGIALWNSKGRARYDLYGRINRLRDDLRGPVEYLQRQELARARRDLREARDALIDGDPVDKLTPLVEALQTYVQAKVAAAKKLADTDLPAVDNKLAALDAGLAYRDALRERLVPIEPGVREGRYDNLEAVQQELDKVEERYNGLKSLVERFTSLPDRERIRQRVDEAADLATMEDLVERMEKVGVELKALDAKYQGRVRGWLDAVDSLEGMEHVMGRVQAVLAKLEGLPEKEKAAAGEKLDQATTLEEMEAAVGVSPPKKKVLEGTYDETRRELAPEREVVARPGLPGRAWSLVGLKLRWARLGVLSIVYLFTLVVGWVTLYAASPTFGADAREYVTLFLWGVSATAIGSQGINLQTIFDKAKEEASGGAGAQGGAAGQG